MSLAERFPLLPRDDPDWEYIRGRCVLNLVMRQTLLERTLRDRQTLGMDTEDVDKALRTFTQLRDRFWAQTIDQHLQQLP